MERSKSWLKKVLSKEILIGTVALFMLSFGNVVFAASPYVNVQAQQTKKITGTVVDASGAPVIGATVMQKGTSNGTITDIDGNFTLDVPTGSIVVISYMGYVTQEITIGNQQNYFVTMQDDSKAIDEVVVTALGIKRSSKALGYMPLLSLKEMNLMPI